MGHTHVPTKIPVGEGTATYVNVGSWHEEEPALDGSGPRYSAARTHLVIHPDSSGPTAEFLTWSPEGPRLFVERIGFREGAAEGPAVLSPQRDS